MISVRVLLTAFGKPNEERIVDIPMEPEAFAILKQSTKLDQVFHYGQNDIQPKQQYSVSCGDVIILDNAYHLVCGFGFKTMSIEEFHDYIQIEPVLRALSMLN